MSVKCTKFSAWNWSPAMFIVCSVYAHDGYCKEFVTK